VGTNGQALAYVYFEEESRRWNTTATVLAHAIVKEGAKGAVNGFGNLASVGCVR